MNAPEDPEPTDPGKASNFPETARAEYQEANRWWRTLSRMRRRDTALLTMAHGSIFALINFKLSASGLEGVNSTFLPDERVDFVFCGLGAIIAYVGYIDEKRLYAYIQEFRERGKKIEEQYGMELLTLATIASETATKVKSSIMLKFYHMAIGSIWLVYLIAGSLTSPA